MGAENSTPAKVRDDRVDRNYTEKAIQEALERQRKMFEQKCNMIIQSQSHPAPPPKPPPPPPPQPPQHYPTTQNSYNYNRFPPPQMPASTSNTLYPNIQEHRILENNQIVQGHVHPACAPNLHEFQFSSVVPSAPVESLQREIYQQIESKGAIPKCRGNQGRQPNNNNNNKNQSLGCVSCSGSYGMYIYQCQNGHSSCMKCKSTCKPCGICSKPITEMRNITLETLIEGMGNNENNNQEKLKCTNAKDGCCLSFTKETLTDHLKECPFMDLDCPLTKIFSICKWKGKVNHLSVHFNDVHPEHCIAEVGKQMTLLDTNTNSVIVYFIKIGSFNFLFYIKRDQEQTIYMTAQLFGTKVSASKWIYEVHVYNKKAPRRKFTYIDICNSYGVPVEDIFNKGQCAIINQQYASTFFNNKELTYEFYIKNVPNNKRYRFARTEQNA